jgi:hypothetical protein
VIRCCPLLFALLIYVTLDLSLPAMPGAFVFDPAGSVDGVRGRLSSEVIVFPAPAGESPLFSQQPRSDIRYRLPLRTEVVLHWRPVVNRLPRATAASPPPSEDPH